MWDQKHQIPKNPPGQWQLEFSGRFVRGLGNVYFSRYFLALLKSGRLLEVFHCCEPEDIFDTVRPTFCFRDHHVKGMMIIVTEIAHKDDSDGLIKVFCPFRGLLFKDWSGKSPEPSPRRPQGERLCFRRASMSNAPTVAPAGKGCESMWGRYETINWKNSNYNIGSIFQSFIVLQRSPFFPHHTRHTIQSRMQSLQPHERNLYGAYTNKTTS